MRVISGSARGRNLKGPPRRRADGQGVRPSSDLVKGAIFDALAALGCDLSYVLDLYAGTGALGIEALSRGADRADFVERDRKLCDILKDNLDATGFREQARVLPMTAERARERLSGPYTLVLADPPYADDAAMATLRSYAESAELAPGRTAIVLEHSARLEPPASLGRFTITRALRHGDSAVSIYLPAREQADRR